MEPNQLFSKHLACSPVCCSGNGVCRLASFTDLQLIDKRVIFFMAWRESEAINLSIRDYALNWIMYVYLYDRQ
jgi:hypothetical protein